MAYSFLSQQYNKRCRQIAFTLLEFLVVFYCSLQLCGVWERMCVWMYVCNTYINIFLSQYICASVLDYSYSSLSYSTYPYKSICVYNRKYAWLFIFLFAFIDIHLCIYCVLFGVTKIAHSSIFSVWKSFTKYHRGGYGKGARDQKRIHWIINDYPQFIIPVDSCAQ